MIWIMVSVNGISMGNNGRYNHVNEGLTLGLGRLGSESMNK